MSAIHDEETPNHSSWYGRVFGLYLRIERSLNAPVPTRARLLSDEEKKFRYECMREELIEYRDATTMEEHLDALVDLVVFAIGTAVRHGFHYFDVAFHRVMDSNDQKDPGPERRNGAAWTFGLVKPPEWKPPILEDLVSREGGFDRWLRLTHERGRIAAGGLVQGPAVHPVLRECAELLAKKSGDYNRGGVDDARSEYHPFGDASYLQMLHTKLTRLKSLRMEGDGTSPNFEAARDSCLDLVNYACFYASYLSDEEARAEDEEWDESLRERDEEEIE